MGPTNKAGEAVASKKLCPECRVTFAEEICPKPLSVIAVNTAISTYCSRDGPEINVSKMKDVEGRMEAPLVSSSRKASTETPTTSNAHPKEHIPYSSCDISHLLFAIDIQIHNILQGSTTDFPYSLSYSDLVAISQALEEIKDLKEHLRYYKDFHQEPNIGMKEPSENDENSTDAANERQEEVTDSTIDTLLKITADQEAEIERLNRESQVLREQLEKLAESNESLVKQNIALRRQTRDLKNASLRIMPLAPSPRISEDFSSKAPQGSEKIADSPLIKTNSVSAQQMASPLPHRPLMCTPITLGLVKLRDKIGKLLSHRKVGKAASSKSPLSYADKDNESHERRTMSRHHSKLTKKRMTLNNKNIPKSSTTSASVGHTGPCLEDTSQRTDIMDAGLKRCFARLDSGDQLFFFVLLSIWWHVGQQNSLPFQELRCGVLLDLASSIPVYQTDAALLAGFETVLEEALDVFALRRSADDILHL